MADYDWLDAEHPIYSDQKSLWEKNERRFFGGFLWR